MVYWTHHDDKKPTLVLVHGFTGSHEGFQYLVPFLTDFRLIIPDLPGFGVSPLPHDRLTLSHLGGLLAEFIDALDLPEPPYVIGHSLGSLAVVEALRQHPDIAAGKLILISPVSSAVGIMDRRRPGALLSELYYVLSHRLPIAGKKLAHSKIITRASTAVIMTARGKAMRKAIYGHHFDNLNFISSIGWYKRLFRQVSHTGITRYRMALKPFDLLIINGDRDKVTPLRYQKKAAKLLSAKLVVIHGVGHLSHYETPAILATEVRNFLK
jgi:pimeloyl-ACP methyl ester carboxylesterase